MAEALAASLAAEVICSVVLAVSGYVEAEKLLSLLSPIAALRKQYCPAGTRI